MSMEKLSVIWHLRITHTYYKYGECHSVALRIPSSTSLLMKKRGVLIKLLSPGVWGMIGNEHTTFSETDRFEVELFTKDAEFPYVTDSISTGRGQCSLLEVNGTEPSFTFPLSNLPTIQSSPGIILRIAFVPSIETMKPMQNGYATQIEFQALKLHLEYLFILRERDDSKTLNIKDTNREILFDEGEKIEYMGSSGWRYQSTNKVTLQQYPNIKIQLSEIMDTGKRILFKQLPYPVPGMFIDAPADTIRTVVYI